MSATSCGLLYPHQWQRQGDGHYCAVCKEKSRDPAWPDGTAGEVGRFVKCPDCGHATLRHAGCLECGEVLERIGGEPSKWCDGILTLPLNPQARLVVRRVTDNAVVYESDWYNRDEYTCSIERVDDTVLLTQKVT